MGKGGGVEDAVCEGGDVEAGEGVGGAGIAADGEEARIAEAEGEDIEDVARELLNLCRKERRGGLRGWV